MTKTAAAFLLLALIGACTPSQPVDPPDRDVQEPVAGGTLEIGVLGEPETLDPYASVASDLTYALVQPVFPMPYRVAADGSIEADLAESIEVNGRRARLTLARRTWSSGRPISARDVVASIERATPPSGFAEIGSARVAGPRSVVLRDGPVAWKRVLARAAFVLPRGRLVGGNVSGGPFRFASYKRGRSIVYEPNPAAEDPPLLDGLTVSFVQGTDLLVKLLERGDLDVAAIPMSVNLDDRLDGSDIAYDDPLGDERVTLSFNPSRVSSAGARALVSEIDSGKLVDSFVRDDGALLDLAPRGRGTAPTQISIAAPEGDELLSLIQRAIQLDLQRAGVLVELITAPVSTLYGSWATDAPADVSLVRSFGRRPAEGFVWPLASVETIVAWRDKVHGIAVNPSLEGPLWNARDWWIEPSI